MMISKIIKIPRNKFNKGGEIPVLWKSQDIDERNVRRYI